MNDGILLIDTGGTIAAQKYDDPKNPPNLVTTLKGSESLIMPIVAQLPNHQHVAGFTWGTRLEQFSKDSKLFTHEDIEALGQTINEHNYHCVIITHGTDAMVKNALELQAQLKGDKVVAFVGAMVPLSMHQQLPSDGIATLRFALLNIEQQKSGVYITGVSTISKNLEFLDPQHFEKDWTTSRATSVFTLMPKD